MGYVTPTSVAEAIFREINAFVPLLLLPISATHPRFLGRVNLAARFRFPLISVFLGLFLTTVLSAVGRYWYVQRYIPRQPLPWREYRPGLVDELRADGRKLLVHFTADWTATVKTPLVLMDVPKIRQAVYLQNYVPVLVDCSHTTNATRDLRQCLNASLIPATVIVDDSRGSPIVLDPVLSNEDLLRALKAEPPHSWRTKK